MTTASRVQLVVWGAAGHALVVADALRLGGAEVVGFLDDVEPSRLGSPFGGACVLGGQEQLAVLRAQGVTHGIVAFGNCLGRLTCAQSLREAGFELFTAVHPQAVIAAGSRVGAGSFVAAGVVVNPGVRVGESVILNTGSMIDHDCTVGDGAHIGPRVALGGGTVVGKATRIGIGATVIDHIQIGDRSVIGAGALVLKDIPPGVVAYGVPARVVRAFP